MDRVRVWLDVFPARVTINSNSISGVRAVVTDDRLLVFKLGHSGPEVVSEFAVEGGALQGSVAIGHQIETASGTVYVDRAGGCGCGSGLRSADLFPGYQRVMVGR